MKTLLKRMSAGLLALFIVISLLPVSISAAHTIITTPTGYTSADDVDYVKNGKYVANWGARGEVCVFLSSYAQNFYTGSNTFDALSALTGGSSQNNAPQSALYSALKSFMSSKHTYETSYNATRDLYRYTDCLRSDYSKISSFYSGTMLNGAWDGGSTWNREHTWPNSKGLGGNDENDIMMLRPTAKSENFSRGNKGYGIASSCYDPGTDVRGDCARIFLYVYTRWGNTNGNGQYPAWGTNGVFQSLDVLLDWMEEDPVDTWEMGRNDAVQAITGTRNVFVDYPEFAWLMFGQDVPEGITTPSDNDGVTANPGGNTGSGGSSSGGSSSGGNTSANYTQVSSLKDGDKVVIVNPGSKMALSATKTGFYNVGIDVSSGFGSITDAEIFTAKKNSDGTWSFTSATGKKLALAAEYNSLNEEGTNDKWELTSAGTNQFYMKNIGRDVYLDWYADRSNWSTYNPDTLDSNYVLAFYTEKTTSSGGSNSGSSGNTGSSGNSGNTGNSGSTNTSQPATQPSSTGTTNPVTSTPPSSNAAPAPMATNSVPAPTLPKGNTESNPNSWILIVVLIAVVLIGGGVAVYFFVIKPKKSTFEAEPIPKDVSDEETPEEPSEEISDSNE